MHTFGPVDHSAHLADTLARLYKLEDLVRAGDREGLLRLAMDMDWQAIVDEFELVVASHCYALENYAHRVSYNLLHPYLQLQDCLKLEEDMRILEGAIDESPSLLDDADAAVAKAWHGQVERARRRHRAIREVPAVTTLGGLRAAVAEKVGLGRRLTGRDGRFDAGERVAYGEIDPGRGDAP